MSFSMDVKDELSKQMSNARHCRIAELSAIISFCGKYSDRFIKVSTENLTVAVKYFILLEKTFKIRPEVLIRNSRSAVHYNIIINDPGEAAKILKATGITDDDISMVTANTCCKRSYIRGAFMAAGQVTDPNKSYHLEIIAGSSKNAEHIRQMLLTFGITARCTIRKKNNIVYVKEGAQIADILSVMEAHVALMDMENVRILKEMRNKVNRTVNCETANISKTTEASGRVQQDIEYIRDNIGLEALDEALYNIAELRMEYPEASLAELGSMMDPPLGKSGVNHRLRKLCEIASDLRRSKEDNRNDAN